MLTIYFDETKLNRQVIKLSDKFFDNNNHTQQHKIAQEIAFDVTRGLYYNYKLEIN